MKLQSERWCENGTN